ncbi:hypothetical protein L3X38_030342 [Prunus dulcis]|uniref:Bulb-type lectin domain-containing protein n=1 Tax=Prunus dulcis TaxID=3755 RepID=A0AAD4VC91_PRUDU|nr:hypothetical protein L3X38_030342 [Prunus dulcis]
MKLPIKLYSRYLMSHPFMMEFSILPFSIIAQTYNNISLGSSLTAKDNNNSVWCSPFGEFAFGFQKIGMDGGFILAIWFNKIPEKTIVWSANGNNLVQQGSTVELTAHGQLMLNDIATGKQKRIADFGGTGVAYAAPCLTQEISFWPMEIQTI